MDADQKKLKNAIDFEKVDYYVKIESQQFKSTLVSLYPNLTTKEIVICALIRCDFNIKQKASYLYISPRTVETHRSNIRRKLGINAKDSLQTFISAIKV
jgi:DNA-binding NarL/FixJ family response regulator